MAARCRDVQGGAKKFNLEVDLIENGPDLLNYRKLQEKRAVIEPISPQIDAKGSLIDLFFKIR